MPIASPFGDVSPITDSLHDTFMHKIEEVIKEDPNKKALINAADYNDVVTYKQLRDAIYSVATFLHNIGFEKQIACTVLPNCSEFLIFSIGVQMQGGGVSGASALFTDYELGRQLSDSRCSVVLTDTTHLEKVLTAAHHLHEIKAIVVIGAGDDVCIPPKCIRWDDVVNTAANFSRPQIQVNLEEDIAILPYSSGTTGSPKGVMLTHRNFVTMLKIFNQTMRGVRTAHGSLGWKVDYALCFLPFYHMYGYSLLCSTLSQGNTAVVMSHFDPHLFCKCIQDFKIETISIVPPIMVMLAKSPIPDAYYLSSIVAVTTGAAPAGRDLVSKFLQRFPGIRFIHQAYGMTEVSLASHLPDSESHKKFGSVGKLAMGYTMKIVNVETGAECSVGKAGEICVRSATVMKGYLNRPDATKETIKNGWMHTGDIGYVDEDGDLFIVDRLKELIKVKGLQVPPAELEDLLLSHPGIKDAAVIGVPDNKDGEHPKAFVVRAHSGVTAEEVAAFVAAKLSPYKHLNGGVEFVDEIPKSASGKILRRFLRDRHASKL